MLANMANSQDAGLMLSEFIYEEAPYPSCHASTIEETPDGIVAAWFGGTDERDPDVGIWFARRTGDGWSKSVELANGVQYTYTDGTEHRHPTWNPVLFQAPEGPLLLFYKAGPTPRDWWGMLMQSDDGGETWSTPRRLPEGILGPVKNKPVLLPGGDLLCPTSSEHDGWQVYFERTSDHGVTWSRTPALNDGRAIKAIQPSILFLGGDRLLALGRTQQKKVFAIESPDNGRTWGELGLLDLPNPSAGTDAVTLADGRHLLVYNHTTSGRHKLNVAISKDGYKWDAAVALEDQPGEYSYPAVIQADNGLVHITYTWRREKVRHAIIDPAKLTTKPIVKGEWPE